MNEWAGFQLHQSHKTFLKRKKLIPPDEGNTYMTTIHPTDTAYSIFETDSLMIIPNEISISAKTAKK